MNTRAMPDLSTIEVARLDPASLRLVTRAVEIEARRLRAEAMRDLLSQAGRSSENCFGPDGIAHTAAVARPRSLIELVTPSPSTSRGPGVRGGGRQPHH